MKKLLGRKKTPEENPYAQQQAEQDDYNAMTPYQRAQANIGQNRPGGLPGGPGPRRDNNSPAPSNQGYGADRYGSGGGYGGDRYGGNVGAYASNQATSNATPSISGRSGGYGGFGPRDEAPSANDSNNLFGGAKGRVEPGQNPYGNNPYANPPTRPDLANNPYANPGARSGASQGDNAPDYGGSDYANENLSPEELEEREYRQVKAQVKQQRADNLATTQRTVAMTERIIETGAGTLARLGQQSERLHRTEQNLNIASVHAKTAEDKTKELKTLNRSMFAVHVGNPFTKSKRAAEAEQVLVDRSNSERRQREETRAGQYQANQRMEQTFQEIEAMRSRPAANTKKYDFSDSDMSEDEKAMATEEYDNLDRTHDNLKIINALARKQGEEVDRQNGHIDRIMGRVDGVHDHVVRNDAKLRTIK